MADPSDRTHQPSKPPLEERDLEEALQQLTHVLLNVASARFDVQAGRTYRGDAVDVLAFLVNSTAEEVEHLLGQLKREQQLLQEAKDQLAQSEKAAALGVLAGGVAHELNQPLTAIETLVDLMLERPEATIAECAPDLELIGRAARRMSKIVRGVRAFASDDSYRRQRTKAVEPMAEAAQLLGESLRSRGLTLCWRVSDPIPDVYADADRLQQVFINLIHNAADALEELEGPRVRTIVLSVEPEEHWVRYVVEDSGDGVPEAVLPRIFDPFFTTKPVGRGTGLGLSISHGIVREHGGTLHCERSGLGGAQFVVRLPRMAQGFPDEAA